MFVIPNFCSACIFFCKITTAIKNRIINTTRATKHITNRTLTTDNPIVLSVAETAVGVHCVVGIHCVHELEVEARQGHKY